MLPASRRVAARLRYCLRSRLLGLAVLLAFLPLPETSSAAPWLEKDVLPLLTKRCMGCHGGLRQEGGLDLRTVPAMLQGGDSGPALEPGDAESSLLWQQVVTDEMPAGENKLSADEKAILREWIAAGLPTLAQQQEGAAPLLPPGSRHEPAQVAAAIDQHIEQALQPAGLQPLPIADDADFLRRIYLDLTGRVPTAQQAAAFLDSDDPQKRAKLIDSLLAKPEFGEQLGRTWRDWICPPELPSDPNGGKQPHREAQDLGTWLAARFAAGDPWDKIVREILTVEGEIGGQPHVIFFGLVGNGGKATPEGSARAVASLFMGVQLKCAQCHDDPYRAWSQQEYWALAAFFSKTSGDFSKITEARSAEPARITIPSSAFKNAGATVPAAFLRDEPYQPTGKEQPLRPELVVWLTANDNPFFARAFANRLWFYFFSRGIVNPVDDFRPLNPPSHPGLIQLLAQEFAAADFDIKHLIRCICNTQAYQRTSHPASGTSEADNLALTDNFGRMPLRVMTADMLYDSLKLAYGDPQLDLRAIDPEDGNTSGESAPVADAYLEFLRCFESNEEDATDFTHGIPQMLTMINHPRLLQGSRALDEFLQTQPSPAPEATIEWLYLATLSRRPSDEEWAEAMEYIRQSETPNQGFRGVLWMLVNRSEYLFVR